MAASERDRSFRSPTGQQVVVVEDSVERAAASLAGMGERTGLPVIVLSGSADSLADGLRERLLRLFGPGLIGAAEDVDAAIVDGGTRSGVMELIGQAAAARDARRRLIGVAPRGRVSVPGDERGESDLTPVDPNHGVIVLAPSDQWGGELGTMFELIDGLAEGAPVVLVLVGGGSGSGDELRAAIQRNWPIFVLQETSGLADAVAGLVSGETGHGLPATVAKLLETADVRLVPASTTDQQLRSQLVRALSDEDILTGAWRRFVAFNQAANERQRTFQRIYQGIVVLGVLATLVALLQTVLLAHHVIHRSQPSGRFFQVLVVILPISLTALIAANNKFRDGSKWIGFRQAAESVKQEIFRFRTRTGPYGPAQGAGTPANRLAERLGAISEGLMKSDVNEASYRQPSAALPEGVLEDGDDGISHLSPDGYLRFRVQNQMTYYSQKARQHERETRLTWWAVLVIGSAGSVLAALGFGLWVALTTSIAAAIAAYVHVMRIENSLIQYNQAHAALSALRDWWSALGRVDRTSPARFDDLVDRAERIFESERAGWLKQMTDAMADLRAEQRTGHVDEPSTHSIRPTGPPDPDIG